MKIIFLSKETMQRMVAKTEKKAEKWMGAGHSTNALKGTIQLQAFLVRCSRTAGQDILGTGLEKPPNNKPVFTAGYAQRDLVKGLLRLETIKRNVFSRIM